MRCSAPSFIKRKATWGSRLLLSALAVTFLAVPLAAAPAPGANAPKARGPKLDVKLEERAHKTTGESDVIIEFTNDKDALKVIKGFGKAGRKLGILKAYSAKVPNSVLTRLAAHNLVKKVSLDRDVSVLNGRTAVATGARAAQQLSGYTGAGVTVAVIDSGVTGWHDDLTAFQTYSYQCAEYTPSTDALGVVTYTVTYQTCTSSYWAGQRVVHFADFVNGYEYPYDDFGHGTHVTGTIAGNGLASGGERAAIAPDASIVSLKALDGQGHGTISGIIAAIDYAVTMKDALNIRVINLSVGAGVYESYNTDPLTQAAKRAVDAGIVVVAAAGNLGKAADGSPQYGAITAPANAPWVLTVGASSTEGTTDRSDDVMGLYSSRGPTMYDYSAKPDLVAPGTGTVSLSSPGSLLYTTKPQLLLPGFTGDPSLDGTTSMTTFPYMSLTGTSMSAPVVSGTVALMLQANPNLTPNLVKAILQFTSEANANYNWLTQGAGFLNARAAVTLSEYFATAQAGADYPDMTGWARHIIWGNYLVSGGVLAPGGTAWGNNVVWGDLYTPTGQNVVWGENCPSDDPNCDNVVWGNNVVWGESCDTVANPGCDNVVWGNTDGDNVVWGNGGGTNVVWGNGDTDNVVWGNSDGDNVVWGNDCQGADCDNVVWGNSGVDNVVWGNCEDSNGDGVCDDNVVWGNCEDADGDGNCDNVVWGNECDASDPNCNDNVVWGNECDPSDPNCDNVVWGNNVEDIVFGDEGADISAFDASVWDDLFRVSVLLRRGAGGR